MLEKSPKWEALTEVLQEIERENRSSQHEQGKSSCKGSLQYIYILMGFSWLLLKSLI